MSHRLSWSGVASAVAVAAVLLLAAPVSRAGPAPTPSPSPSPSLAVPLAPLPASLAEAARQGPSGGYANGLIFPGLAVALGTAPTSGQCLEYNGTVITGAACSGGGGGGTVTVVGGGSLTSTAIVTGGGTTTIQTPSGGSTLDSSGNMILAGSLTAGGSLAAGSSCTPMGASAHGGVCMGENASTGWTPTAGFTYFRADSGHTIQASVNGGSEAPLTQGPTSDTSGNLASFSGTAGAVLADSGVVAANVITDASNLGAAGIVYQTGNKTVAATTAATLTSGGTLTATLYATATKCAAAGSAANPSLVACSAAPAGFFSCATNASTGTCVVSTTAVTANSVIQIQPDSTLGTALSVTCNTTADSALTAPRVSARSAGTSFTITLGTFSTNPVCFSYIVIN